VLAQEARKLIPTIKIILASGYPTAALSGENSGIHDFQFITKPYRLAEFVKKLRTSG
jgi:DNA-binding LytR/AlgR family response regulator